MKKFLFGQNLLIAVAKELALIIGFMTLAFVSAAILDKSSILEALVWFVDGDSNELCDMMIVIVCGGTMLAKFIYVLTDEIKSRIAWRKFRK